jgi:hypothetical protein
MKVTELLAELRRNPEQNKPVNQREHLADYLRELGKSGGEIFSMGVSMTAQPKVGINPGSKYDTPIGIYYYPANYFLKHADEGLPFMDEAPYLQLFRIEGPVLEIDSITDRDYRKLTEQLAQLARGMRISAKYFNEIVNDAQEGANVKTPGGRLWYVMYRMSGEGTGRGRAHIMWNWLIRQLGYVAVEDTGDGIIHANEPTQGMVVDPRAVKDAQQFKNDTLRKDTFGDPVQKTLRVKPDEEPYRFFKHVLDILSQLRDPQALLQNQSRSHYMVSNFARLLKHNPAWNKEIVDFRPLKIAQAVMPQTNLVGDWVLWRWNNVVHPHVVDLLAQAEELKQVTDDDTWREGAANFTEAMSLVRVPKLVADDAGVELPGYDAIAAQLNKLQLEFQHIAAVSRQSQQTTELPDL